MRFARQRWAALMLATLLGTAAHAQTDTAGHSEGAGDGNEPTLAQQAWARPLVAVLPPEPLVRSMLLVLPVVQAAQSGRAVAAGRQARLAAGPHEWVAHGTLQSRRESAGPRYTENEFALEHGVRLSEKRVADESLSRLTGEIAHMAFDDTWHEAARALMKAWFDWLREAHTRRVLADQVRLADEQLSVAQKRQKAGEAARLEVLQAEAEAARVQASWQQAQARERVLQSELQRRYPALGETLSAMRDEAMPEPSELPDSPPIWVDRVLDDNHEIELAQAQAKQAELQAQRVGLEKRADPVLGVRASRERGGTEQVVAVYMTLPLGGAGRRADEQIALAEAQQAQNRAADVRLKVSGDAWQVTLRAAESDQAWRSLERARERMEQSARLATRAYTLGELPLGEALQARRLALEARLNAEAARMDTLESQSRLLLDAHQMWIPPGHAH
jgi:hypothetical protein